MRWGKKRRRTEVGKAGICSVLDTTTSQNTAGGGAGRFIICVQSRQRQGTWRDKEGGRNAPRGELQGERALSLVPFSVLPASHGHTWCQQATARGRRTSHGNSWGPRGHVGSRVPRTASEAPRWECLCVSSVPAELALRPPDTSVPCALLSGSGCSCCTRVPAGRPLLPWGQSLWVCLEFRDFFR